MYSTKITVATAILLLCITATAFIMFSKSNSAQEIRYGISQSIDEDFKIKESLGQVFFVENSEDTQSVSANITVQGKVLPANGEIIFNTVNGEKIAVINCEKYSNIYAVENGNIENAEKGTVTIRHNDGSKSVYTGVRLNKKKGDTVFKGEKIGYSIKEIEFKMYGRACTVIDLEEYFA